MWVLAGCARTPVSPSNPPAPPPVPGTIADFSGYWSGTFTYQGCAGTHCIATTRTDPFSLRLRQRGGQVTGVFASPAGNVAVAGDVQADGSLPLAGTEATGGTRGVPGQATFRASELRLDPARGLTGTLRFEWQPQRADVPAGRLADGPIVSATHGNLDSYIADVAGTWSGLYLVRECVEQSGRPLCGVFQPDEVEYIQLTLTVSGSSAAGEVMPVSTRIPVTGQVSARTIALEGARDDASQGLHERIAAFSGAVDEFGRLNGKFTYLRTFAGVTSRAEVDLIRVVKP